MAKKKIFEADEEIVKMVREQFEKNGFNDSMTLQVFGITKQKDVVKASKAPEPTEFLTEKENIIQVFVYEGVFNELDEETQRFLIEFALQPIWFDSDKGKVVIDKNPYNPLFELRKKYGNRADELLETSYVAIQQAEDLEKSGVA
jgi:hypothetical protein